MRDERYVTLLKSQLLFDFDAELCAKHGLCAGTDEAGRGPLAGPVVAAAVVLDAKNPVDGVADSKKLSPASREKLYDSITSNSLSWAVGLASVEEIDQLNILQASLLAMHRAVSGLGTKWQKILIDGNQYIPQIDRECQITLVKGDGRSACVAAASIIAKVTRDRLMHELHTQYPDFGFADHKGYGTARHISAIRTHGVSPVHRRSFCDHLVADFLQHS